MSLNKRTFVEEKIFYKMQELKSLNEKGLTGRIAFWMVIFNLLMPICTTIFSIYWLVLLGDKIWLQSVGSSLFVSNFFTMFFSLAAFVFNILSTLKIKIIYEKMTFQIFIIMTIISFILCCISLSLSSYSSADRAYQDIIDYCNHNPGKSDAVKFYAKYSTFISQKNYVLHRTVESKSILAGIFGTWIGSFVIYILVFHLLKEKEDGQLLLDHDNEE